MDCAREIARLIKCSPKHERTLEALKTIDAEGIDGKGMAEPTPGVMNTALPLVAALALTCVFLSAHASKIKKSSCTRITVRGESHQSLLDDHAHVCNMLDRFTNSCNESDSETRARCRAAMKNMVELDFMLALLAGIDAYGTTDALSEALQRFKTSVLSAIETSKGTVATLRQMRNDIFFQTFWDKCQTHFEKVGSVNEAVLQQNKQARKCDQMHHSTLIYGLESSNESESYLIACMS